MLTVPCLGLEDVKVGNSPDQSYLDREGIMHLSGTGSPYQKGSNTYIAAHAIGYSYSRIPYAFRNLEDMENGDRVIVEDTSGETYQYRVYERMIVDPSDFWVTKPVEGKTTISLQTCTPILAFDKRLIVRGELVSWLSALGHQPSACNRYYVHGGPERVAAIPVARRPQAR